MSPLTDEQALELLDRAAGQPRASGYHWEAMQHLAWQGDRCAADLLHEASYHVVFDPNPWLMPTRMRAGLHFGRDEAALGYLLTREELLEFCGQDWTCYTDFYVFGNDGVLCALRTHEDPEPDYGFWIPARSA